MTVVLNVDIPVDDGGVIPRGAVDGPLARLIPVYVDIEATFDKARGISLGQMTLREYCRAANMTSLVVAIGDAEPEFFALQDGRFVDGQEEILDSLRAFAESDEYVFVAHNAAFDARFLRHKYGIPHPRNVWCTMEGAMAAWPEFPKGFGLKNLGTRLRFPPELRKLEIDLSTGKHTLEELRVYNIRDVTCMRELYLRQIARIPAREQRIALLTHGVRKWYFRVDQDAQDILVEKLDKAMENAEGTAAGLMADDYDVDAGGEALLSLDELRDIFNRENEACVGQLHSIRTQRLMKIIEAKFGVVPPTTQLKKLSPVWQAKYPKITQLITATNRANKMKSHQRRAQALHGQTAVDLELGYARATTFRFSSPGPGGAKHLNIHNCVAFNTPVLTERGWVPVQEVQDADRVWDGLEWVGHSGLRSEGRRECLGLRGGAITPEHPVLVTEGLFLPAGSLTRPGWDTARRTLLAGLPLPAPESAFLAGEYEVFDLLDCGPRHRFATALGIVANCPKHDIELAQPIRQTYRAPEGYCFVRGDLSNVEYRVVGMLAGCRTITSMFDPAKGGNVLTDPYIALWRSMTGQVITKKDLERQVSKTCALGLSFLMSALGFIAQLLKAITESRGKVTEATIADIIKRSGWPVPPAKALNMLVERSGCSVTIATAAYHLHRLFNEAHCEFDLFAKWLIACATVVSEHQDIDAAKRRLDVLRRAQAASPYIHFTPEKDISEHLNLRISCGPWDGTLVWRDIQVRADYQKFDSKARLSVMKTSLIDKPLTRQLAIENVTQAAARNGLCMGLLELQDRYGITEVFHVHDELLLIVPRQREAVLNARDRLLSVFGPTGSHPLGWATVIKPDEVSVTESLYESEEDITVPYMKNGKLFGGDRWGRIERNEPGALDGLP